MRDTHQVNDVSSDVAHLANDYYGDLPLTNRHLYDEQYVHDDHTVTEEASTVYLLNRAAGRHLQKYPISTAPVKAIASRPPQISSRSSRETPIYALQTHSSLLSGNETCPNTVSQSVLESRLWNSFMDKQSELTYQQGGIDLQQRINRHESSDVLVLHRDGSSESHTQSASDKESGDENIKASINPLEEAEANESIRWNRWLAKDQNLNSDDATATPINSDSHSRVPCMEVTSEFNSYTTSPDILNRKRQRECDSRQLIKTFKKRINQLKQDVCRLIDERFHDLLNQCQVKEQRDVLSQTDGKNDKPLESNLLLSSPRTVLIDNLTELLE